MVDAMGKLASTQTPAWFGAYVDVLARVDADAEAEELDRLDRQGVLWARSDFARLKYWMVTPPAYQP